MKTRYLIYMLVLYQVRVVNQSEPNLLHIINVITGPVFAWSAFAVMKLCLRVHLETKHTVVQYGPVAGF